ncbi:MAG TPA: response regulator transcription factor [Candidatus Sulfotelmatobacter sp.]|jgi:DNA-binding NarL/FixJ family response regulator|nr:response regulator transcription factor [Candidatus Sulfotelmatobacter sp.]
MPLQIAIADDSAAIRSALRTYIESHTDWQVCGEAEDGQSAVFIVQHLQPHVLILDLSMPVLNGLEAARQIAVISPKTRIVLFTAHTGERVQREAKKVGIRSVIAKDGDATLQRLVITVRDTACNDAADAQAA